MAKLIYSAVTSLDSYVEDRNGSFDWAVPDDEVFSYINERERPVGTYLYGRRMYETMVYWETQGADVGDSALEHDFAAIWRAANKIVYSTTLPAASSRRTVIERDFDDHAIRQLKETSSLDLSIAGADLASRALRAGLIDEIQLYVLPIVIGDGKPALTNLEPVRLELVDERRFSSGTVFLHYAVVM